MKRMKWWEHAIGYEIYPMSFKDSNNDGVGDLPGIISKLDYLHDLGVNLLWICPIFKSPMDDNGYDVSDYYSINPMFGNEDDFRKLIKEAHARDMHVIMDFVLNHTSDEHPWFKKAQEDPYSKERNYYFFRKGKVVDNKELPPNNWKGFFSTSVWSKDEISKDYYFHIFSKKMPDVNWDDKNLRQEYINIANHYIDLGVDGFRLDAIAHLSKDTSFVDSDFDTDENGLAFDMNRYSNRPKLYKYLKILKKKVFSRKDIFTIGEVGGCASTKSALLYSHKRKGSINMVFNFDTVWENGAYGSIDKEDKDIHTNLVSLKNNLMRWYNDCHKKASMPLYWCNHDHPRVLTQYGSKTYPVESAKTLGLVLLFLYGTPFIYNGEEIGIQNIKFTKLEDIHDVSSQNYIKEVSPFYKEEIILRGLNRFSRIHARSPMQWDTSKYAGFSNKKPDVPVMDEYKKYNVEVEISDPNSILNFYKKAIAIHKDKQYEESVLFGKLEMLDMKDDNVMAFIHHGKKKLAVIANFREFNVEFSFKYEIKDYLLHNYGNIEMFENKFTLRPFECYLLELEK